MQKQYLDIWIRGVRGIFSWETQASVKAGARVVVLLRGRRKVGIVVNVGQNKPKFKTQKILEIWDESFISEKYIQIAKEISKENFTSLEKILSLMVPDKYCTKRDPVVREIFYKLNSKEFELRGTKQKKVIEILKKENGHVSAEILKKDISLATIKGLIEKEIILEEKGEIKNIFIGKRKSRPSFKLTTLQRKVYDQIQKSKKPNLLFGVTGSGKTEIYKKLAEDLIKKDPTAQILFLLPEIALTSQLIAEFHAVFGEKLAVWHSKLSVGEKIQEYERIRLGESQILIGTRSAVFVPLIRPKLIILDEEHEWTFKNEFAPRYWTHDVVQEIAKRFDSKIVFGTATPRLESFVKCEKGEWDVMTLSERVHDVQMPEIRLIDLANEGRKGNDSPISELLEEELTKILKQKKQAMIFLNKRGYSGATFCKKCGHTFECPNCSYNMKMHSRLQSDGRQMRKFICHVCGHLENFPHKCPECEADDFVFRGWGTQMVEKILNEKFSGIRVFRADADTVSGKHDFEKLMDRFHNYEADVLLGTQMIAKGLDFDRVQLVGVILADVGLSLPDFRAEERVFQLLTQVSGRAGRRKHRGKIVIQTFHPEEKIFEFVKTHDSQGFLEWQLETRKKSKMPPFSSLAKITFSDVDKKEAYKSAQTFFKKLKTGTCDIQFAPAFFPRSHSRYHFHVFVRAKKKEDVVNLLSKFELIGRGVKIDMDPVSLL